ncbi:MAG: MATE family efflux transporter [Chitinophagaceae bacterium]
MQLLMSMVNKAIDLRVGISNKQILKLALPISASIIVPQLNFIINNIFLGSISQQALAVAGITGVFYLIFAVIGNGFNTGLQSLIARKAGKNEIPAIASLLSNGISIAIITSCFGIAFTYFLAPSILKATLKDTSNVQMAVDFLRIRIWGLPLLYLYQLRNALLVGVNQSKFLIIGTAAEAVSNVFFDYVLIYGKLGFPVLGFLGAAYASIIAEAVGLISIFFVIRNNSMLKQITDFEGWRIDVEQIKLIFKQSLPLVLQFAISIISWEFFYILIEHHGQLDLAVSNTMRNIFGFFGCFTWAFASTTNTMVSNVIGQGLQEKVMELIYKIIRLSVLFAIIICILLNVFPHVFLSIYAQDEAFIQAGIPVLRIISVGLIVMSVSVVWTNAVIATGNTKVNLQIELVTIILYCVYVYVVLEVLFLSITWGWASELIYWTSLLIPSYWYIKSGKWKTR